MRRPRPLRTSRREMIHGNNEEVRLGRREGREGCKVSSLTHSLPYLTFFACKFGNRQKWSSLLGGTFWGPHEHSSHVIYFSRLGIFLVFVSYSASVITAGLYSGFRRLRR